MTLGVHKAPCGHPGKPIIGTFVVCTTKGCDGKPRPKPVDPPIVMHRCPACGSLETEVFDAAGIVTNLAGIVFWHCLPCGNVFVPGGIP